MHLNLDLHERWFRYVMSGKSTTEFQAVDDRPGYWSQGDRIIAGLRLNHDKIPEFFAKNATTGDDLDLKVLMEPIGNSGFQKKHIAHRSLKPGAVSGKRTGRCPDLAESPENCPFKCEEPMHPWSFFHRRPFALIQQQHRSWACYANFSPFEENGHFIWLPCAHQGDILTFPHILQEMTPGLLHDTLDLSRSCSNQIVFHNSLHAGASANHFHLQACSIQQDERLPIEQAAIEDGAKGQKYLSGYPIEALAFDEEATASDVFACIDALVKAGKAYNLITIRRRTFLIPRDRDYEIVSEFPFGTLASMEVSGRFIIAEEENYRNAKWEHVLTAFKKTGLSRQEIETIMR